MWNLQESNELNYKFPIKKKSVVAVRICWENNIGFCVKRIFKFKNIVNKKRDDFENVGKIRIVAGIFQWRKDTKYRNKYYGESGKEIVGKRIEAELKVLQNKESE